MINRDTTDVETSEILIQAISMTRLYFQKFASVTLLVLGVSFCPVFVSVAPAQQTGENEKQQEGTNKDEKASDSATKDDKKWKAEKQSNQQKKKENESKNASSSSADDKSDDKGDSGPGGTKLREDYPGTDEAMKGQMETNKLKGLEFEEGQQSQNPYKMEMKELETRVDSLKEKVFRSKSRIALLKETVLSGKLAGSRAIIIHISELGSQYALTQASYSIDGDRVFNESVEDGSLADKDQIEVYNGMVEPGHHRVGVLFRYQGSGYGIFSYMDEYKFKIKDACEFEAIEGKNTIIEVRPVEQGNALTKAYDKRPKVECKTHTVDYSAEDIAGAQ